MSDLSTAKRSKKQARKTFKFWFKVLLETEYMNDISSRQEFMSALAAIKPKKKREH